MSLMLDYYGSFLTERQLELMRMSVDEDMSLSEISEQVGISRQAVRDHLAKAGRELAGLEERLGVISRDRALRAICNSLEEASSSASVSELRRSALNAAESIRSIIR